MDLQVKKSQNKLYKKLRSYKYDHDVVLKFYRKFVKLPKLGKDELPEMEEGL